MQLKKLEKPTLISFAKSKDARVYLVEKTTQQNLWGLFWGLSHKKTTSEHQYQASKRLSQQHQASKRLSHQHQHQHQHQASKRLSHQHQHQHSRLK